MANPMNGFTLDFTGAHRDESQDPRNDVASHLPPAHDPSLMGFPSSHVGNYPFGGLLPHEGDLALQGFDRPSGPQADLEGRLSGVMLAYDSANAGASMPMNLDTSGHFAFDAPTTYPAASMGLAPTMDQTQIHPVYNPFSQPLPHTTGPYLQHLSAPSHLPPHKEQPYNNLGPGSTGSFEDSDFSRASERPRLQNPRPIQERPRASQAGQPIAPRASQPVAIQPKKPAVIKSKSIRSEELD